MRTKLSNLILGAFLFFASPGYSTNEIPSKISQILQRHPTFASDGNRVKIVNVFKSKTAEHFYCQHIYYGIPVRNSLITFHFLNNSDRVLVDDGLQSPVKLDVPPNIENLIIFKTTHEYVYATENILSGKYSKNDTLEIADLNGQRLYCEPTRRFNHGPDSLVSLPVFTPNPVETLKKPYGYPLSDQSDKNSQALSKAYQWTEIPLKSNGKQYLLNHPLFIYKEVSAPYDSAHIFAKNNFPISRQDIGFEAINSYYHLSQYAEYLRKIEYETLLDTLIVDSHGLNGDDQSAFNGSTYPGTLEFGQGGVDDAEDGHVVIHEFVHSLAHKVQPKGFRGKERQAMEEGFADYLALSYSNRISGNNTKSIFTWDGHNEFWAGFELETEKNYFNKTGNVANDREIWSSTLFCISQEIGEQQTDLLVLEQIFYQKANGTMPEMAQNLLLLDSLLNMAINYASLKNCFIQKRILKGDYRDVTFEPGSMLNYKLLDNHPEAMGNPNLTVVFNRSTSFSIEIHDVSGKLVFSQSYSGEFASIKKNHFKSGIYFLSIQQNSLSEVLKIWNPVKIIF